MSTIIDLPSELLSEILAHLSPFELEAVAKTLNKKLYQESFTLLKLHWDWLKFVQESIRIFPIGTSHSQRQMTSAYPGSIPPFAATWAFENTSLLDPVQFKLDDTKGTYYRTFPANLSTFMNLDATLSWLRAPPNVQGELDILNERYDGIIPPPLAEDGQIDLLIQQATDLGLRVPKAFETLLRGDTLYVNIPSSFSWYFRLGWLIPCPEEIDGGNGGYLIRFYLDQQYCAFDYLYLSPSGGHCVIQSSNDFYRYLQGDTRSAVMDAGAGEPPKKRAKGSKAGKVRVDTDDVLLIGLQFEEYLASLYFEELITHQVQPFPELCEYVRNVYMPRKDEKH